jgi:hypothetical protein
VKYRKKGKQAHMAEDTLKKEIQKEEERWQRFPNFIGYTPSPPVYLQFFCLILSQTDLKVNSEIN